MKFKLKYKSTLTEHIEQLKKKQNTWDVNASKKDIKKKVLTMDASLPF